METFTAPATTLPSPFVSREISTLKSLPSRNSKRPMRTQLPPSLRWSTFVHCVPYAVSTPTRAEPFKPDTSGQHA